jgi:hypothetical protein
MTAGFDQFVWRAYEGYLRGIIRRQWTLQVISRVLIII